jgi:hypothetical protein
MILSYKGIEIISHSAKTWWITGFNPQYLNVSSNRLSVTYTIIFNSKGMFDAFFGTKPKGWSFNSKNLSATYTF